MTARHRPIVSNDNSLWRKCYLEADKHGPMSRYLSFVPIAQKLITRYCLHAFKHDKQHPDYCFLEFQLCTLLEDPDKNKAQRNFKIDLVAWVLEQSPMLFHNDPHLPF